MKKDANIVADSDAANNAAQVTPQNVGRKEANGTNRLAGTARDGISRSSW